MFENIGGSELLVILLVVLIFFGPKKMPEMGKNIGKGIREFKKAMRDIQDDVEKSMKEPATPLPPPTAPPPPPPPQIGEH
jgi:sec-independent protein translocase protein TatA